MGYSQQGRGPRTLSVSTRTLPDHPSKNNLTLHCRSPWALRTATNLVVDLQSLLSTCVLVEWRCKFGSWDHDGYWYHRRESETHKKSHWNRDNFRIIFILCMVVFKLRDCIRLMARWCSSIASGNGTVHIEMMTQRLNTLTSSICWSVQSLRVVVLLLYTKGLRELARTFY